MTATRACFHCGAAWDPKAACCELARQRIERNRAYARAVGDGASAYASGLALRDNPWRGKDRGLQGAWTMGWKRSQCGDPEAAAKRQAVPPAFKPKRHAGHTGTKNRI